MPIDQNTSITFGFLATIVGFVIGAVKWLLGLKRDVDRHTEQLNGLEKITQKNSQLHVSNGEKLESIHVRLGNIETKLDLLINNKLK